MQDIKLGLYFFVSLFILLQSCTEKNIDDNLLSSERDIIDFSFSKDSSNINSKSGVITTENLNNLGVFTYTTIVQNADREDYTQKMFNAKYVKGTNRIFTPIEDDINDFMWDSDFHHFFAYAPFDAENIELIDDANINEPVSPNAFPAIKYAQPSSDPTLHTDLLYAVRKNAIKLAGTSNIVNLDFKHALSRISFTAQNINDTTPFKIHSIKMGNISQNGVFRYENEGTSSGWTQLSNEDIYTLNTYSSGTNNPVEINPNTILQLYGNSGSTQGEVGDFLFMLPQGLHSKSSYIIVKYSYINSQNIVEEREKIVVLPEGSEWVMGSAYNYLLNIDPVLNYVTVTAQQIDWASTKDIISEVTYTYLYLEKSTYSLNYDEEGEEILLDINFSTNVLDDELEIFHKDPLSDTNPTDSIVDIPNKANFILNKDTHIIKCKFYPRANSGYSSENIKIKAGIITTDITINFFPVKTFDYTNIDFVNSELGQSADSLIISNCYIINSSQSETREYKIPIFHQINRFNPNFFRVATPPTEEGGETTYEHTNLDNWKVQTYAYDNELATNRISYTKTLGADGKPSFIMSIPQGFDNPGNILVSITNAQTGEILWTWHMWVTDYDPNEIIRNGTTDSSKPTGETPEGIDPNNVYYKYIKYDPTNRDNKVHRYSSTASQDYSYHMDRNIGAYAPSYDGQGSLGGRGWVVYQYGRLAPLFGHQARFADGSNYVKKRVDSGTSGVARSTAISNPSTVYYNSQNVNWCSNPDIIGKVWNDETIQGNVSTDTSEEEPIYKKSIFDPSPLGWMIPPMGEYWVASGWNAYYNSDTNIQLYTSSSGNNYFSTNVIDPLTGIANIVILDYSHIWTNTDVPGTKSMAAGIQFENYTTDKKVISKATRHDTDTPHCLGAGIRPIFQFKVTTPLLP